MAKLAQFYANLTNKEYVHPGTDKTLDVKDYCNLSEPARGILQKKERAVNEDGSRDIVPKK